ncbi:TetR/AcrR family transcriptional regulator [Pseudoalteromonas citrea]|uniref:TetR/AcrR family transcriptional regulator n=1 Tax=Pseudoalteromonas citrea TaxID=43655 RepID=A0A5S3XNC8_9GAMM|nr:TetR/AcrR family transcriptional regulator [Pseudoalteromonas citrea]TMP43006.1 TetR/AcrR family transcriptional regulator [Pseudoalteromonas citrea]TMP58431.1 TetR/AcrR family transcriptional regulator [Pseudoalteromonas citrea]
MTDKKQQLIQTALHLFYTKGAGQVGINEIINTSGVAKKTLYAYFASKDDLILACLRERHDVFMAWLCDELEGANDIKSTYFQLFSAFDKWFNCKVPSLAQFRGCFFINTAAEFQEYNPDITAYCAYHKNQVKALLNRHLQGDSQQELERIFTLSEGAIVSAFMLKNSDIAKSFLR